MSCTRKRGCDIPGAATNLYFSIIRCGARLPNEVRAATVMDIQTKLSILADAAKYDASCASGGVGREGRSGGKLGTTEAMGICHSYTPDGRCVSLLKLLLTNYCIYDCLYCVNRVSSDTPRARFTPEEVAQLTIDFYRRNYIEGLFLSSGIIVSPDHTMELLIRAAKLLRTEHEFGGYIHLKAAPGVSPELLREAGRWADRLSVNVELPVQADLDRLAPAKTHAGVEAAMKHIRDRIEETKDASTQQQGTGAEFFAPAGQSTQMVVGATESQDALILKKSSSLYRTYKLRRVYYSAFSPIPHADSRLPLAEVPLMREHRLYQADWLMRFYGFAYHELTTTDAPNLSLDVDPKLAWALRHRGFFPVNVNRAARWALLRVPGLGARSVERILRIRRHHRLTLEDLARLRVSISKTKWFVVTADHNPALLQLDSLRLPRVVRGRAVQLPLFTSATEARTGEL